MPIDLSGISPIIDAIVNWQKLGQQEKDRKLEQARQKEQERANLERERQANEQLKQRKEEADRQYDLDKVRSEYEREKNYQATLSNAANLASQGIDLSQFSSDRGIPSELQIPEDNAFIQLPGSNVKIPKGAIPDWRQFQNISAAGKKADAFATTQGRNEADEPFKIAEAQRAENLAKIKNQLDEDTRMKVEKYQREGDLQKLGLTLASHERIAKLQDATDRYRADRANKLAWDLGSQDQANAVESYVDMVTLEGKPLTVVPAAKGMRNIVAGRIHEIGRAQLSNQENAMLQALPIYKDLTGLLDDYADTNSGVMGTLSAATGLSIGPTGKGGATAGGLGKQIEAFTPQLVKFLGDTGNLSATDRKSITDLIGVWNSKKDNKAAVEKLNGIIKRVAGATFSKMPREQSEAILANHGLNPDDFLKPKPKDTDGDNDIEEVERGPDGKLKLKGK